MSDQSSLHEAELELPGETESQPYVYLDIDCVPSSSWPPDYSFQQGSRVDPVHVKSGSFHEEVDPGNSELKTDQTGSRKCSGIDFESSEGNCVLQEATLKHNVSAAHHEMSEEKCESLINLKSSHDRSNPQVKTECVENSDGINKLPSDVNCELDEMSHASVDVKSELIELLKNAGVVKFFDVKCELVEPLENVDGMNHEFSDINIVKCELTEPSGNIDGMNQESSEARHNLSESLENFAAVMNPSLTEGESELPSTHSIHDGISHRLTEGKGELTGYKETILDDRDEFPGCRISHENIQSKVPVLLKPEVLNLFERTNQANLDIHNSSPTHEKSYKCDFCGETFTKCGHLPVHNRIHTQKKEHKCDVCGKTFPRSCQLECHKRTHNEEKPFECDLCRKRFSRKQRLLYHKRLHTGEKPFKCDICGKSYPVKASLDYHKGSHIMGEKPFKCDICGQRFLRKEYLKKHNRIHTRENQKPYKCDVCGKTFAQRSYLQEHKRTHTGEEPFDCDVCGKTFAQRFSLQEHIRNHTGMKPFECDVCGKTFAQRSYFQEHIRNHTGKKPFECDACDKTFSRKISLRSHKKNPTGEGPFVCDVCGNVFSRKHYCLRHHNTNTGEKPKKDDNTLSLCLYHAI